MSEIKTLSIDIETFSDVDLGKSGVYRYAESPSFEILLFGYSINSEEVQVVDLASGEVLPDEILSALADASVTKWAFNASFERICLSYWLCKNHPEYFAGYGDPEDTVGNYLDPASWRCSMIWVAYLGLPLSLASAGAALGLEDQKMTEGKELIHYFCMPCRSTKSNGGRTRNLPVHASDKWMVFKSYNKRDVEVEMSIQKRLSKFPVPDSVWEEYHIDQQINDRGIAIDRAVVENAIQIDDLTKTEITDEMKAMTSLDNPNSVSQLKEWLSGKGIETVTLGKKTVKEMIPDVSEDISDVLKLRLQLAKSSVKKYQAMMDTACMDGRARGMFQFYGANRSGRWAGRHIQLQNLPQNHMTDLEQARNLVRAGDYDMLRMLYDDVPDTLSQLIRTAFIPKPGYKFVVSDFSAIEARVLSFLAGEQWRMDVFASNGDIYCASASAMFKVPVEKHGRNANLRQKGKISELALGYGGSVGALKSMGALEMGLQEEELQLLVDMWRHSNPNIVQYWWNIDAAIKKTIKQHVPTEVGIVKFHYESGMLFIQLPSGRSLAYVKPRIGENQFGSETVTYMGIGGTKKWERIESYGPKFVENIVQAISRDILCYAMRTLSHCFIVGHVHDELIIECYKDVDYQVICRQMGQTPSWISGLLLRADGYETEFYKKD
jgi:DNA polymerase